MLAVFMTKLLPPRILRYYVKIVSV
uniref:Uncharacterized protein n=1 Tax=Anguilla anguilla TaxID=7936 RepID=A0A0E9XMA8_ANGAN